MTSPTRLSQALILTLATIFALVVLGALSPLDALCFKTALAAPATASKPADPIPRPKLVLVIVIDQFRADYLTRHAARFLPPQKGSEVGGFRYLMERGAWYPLATYSVLQNMTCVGHATILTGSLPYQNGISLNDWFDGKKPVYCVGDSNHKWVGGEQAEGRGTSPKNLKSSTVGDELKNAGLASRVVTVSLKDRAAILMGGRRADVAIWWDYKSGHWVSSDFYFPDKKLPSWVESLNSNYKSRKGEKLSWTLGKDQPTGRSLEDNLVGEEFTYGLHASFPHEARLDSRGATSLPFGVDATTEAAQKAVEAMKLGSGSDPDLLGVSYSTHDYLGHMFGPNSRELEEITVHEDRSISKLLNTIARKVPGGLKNVTVVLTADHGIPPNPDWLAKNRTEAGRIDEKSLRDQLNAAANEKFGKPKGDRPWVVESSELNFYLNEESITQRGIERAALEGELKSALLKNPEIAFVSTRTEILEKRVPAGALGRQLLNTWHAGRSGDLVAVPRPFFMVGKDRASHHTHYAYDRHVPLVLTGAGIRPGRYAEQAEVIDIAPTLAFILGIVPPTMSEGRVLSEALIAGPQKSR